MFVMGTKKNIPQQKCIVSSRCLVITKVAHPGTLETGHKSCSFANVWPIAFQSAEAEVESVTPLAKADRGSDIYYQGISQKAGMEPESGVEQK